MSRLLCSRLSKAHTGHDRRLWGLGFRNKGVHVAGVVLRRLHLIAVPLVRLVDKRLDFDVALDSVAPKRILNLFITSRFCRVVS